MFRFIARLKHKRADVRRLDDIGNTGMWENPCPGAVIKACIPCRQFFVEYADFYEFDWNTYFDYWSNNHWCPVGTPITGVNYAGVLRQNLVAHRNDIWLSEVQELTIGMNGKLWTIDGLYLAKVKIIEWSGTLNAEEMVK